MEFSEADIIHTAAVIKSMGHPMRLGILCFLGQGPACVQDINQALGSSQSNVSQHLEILSNRRLLQSRKQGNRVFYTIRDARLLAMLPLIRELFCPDLRQYTRQYAQQYTQQNAGGAQADHLEGSEPWKSSLR